MENIPLVSFKEELESLKKDFHKAFDEQIEKGEFIGGSSVENFENNFSEYLSSKSTVGVGNGTDALVIALESLKHKLKITEGKVIVPSFSFFATSEAIVKAGFEPEFVDVSLDTANINIDLIEDKINEEVVGIMPVHLFGKSSEMGPILNLKNKYSLFIVEDVAQAFGATYQGKPLGTIGDAGCYSFFPTKILGAFGDGGAIVSDDSEIIEYSRMLRSHGSRVKYSNEIFGYNSRLDSVQARFLDIKLRKIDQMIASRIEIGNYYASELEGIENIKLLDYTESVFNYFTFLVPKYRDRLIKYLNSRNISTAIYYPKPLPSLEAHKIDNDRDLNFPNAKYLSENIMSIPIWPNMSFEVVDIVVNEITNFFKSNK